MYGYRYGAHNVNNQLLSSTGDIKWGCKFHGRINSEPAVTIMNSENDGVDFDASECCQRCNAVTTGTKAWSKKDGFTRCKCFSFDDTFDIVSLERKHDTTISGYCN